MSIEETLRDEGNRSEIVTDGSSDFDHEEIGHRFSDFLVDKESEDGDASFDLPDALTEKIFSLVPFPDVCKARVLCKEWHEKFPAFIESVPRYCPALLMGHEVLGFDRRTNRWQTMNVKYLKSVWSAKDIWNSTLCGVLLCMRSGSRLEVEAVVVNLVTGKRRKIVCPFEILGFQSALYMPMLIPVGRSNYQILFYNVLGRLPPDEAESILSTFLYDSESRQWSQKYFRFDACAPGEPMVHLDGRFYHTWKNTTGSQVGVLQFNYESGELRKSPSVQFEVDLVDGCSVSVCGSRIVVIVFVYFSSAEEDVGARVYELDPESLLITELSRNPPSLCLDSEGIQVVSDRNSLYFCQHYHLYSYHLELNSWQSHYPLPESYYRLVHKTPCLALDPGVNTFVEP